MKSLLLKTWKHLVPEPLKYHISRLLNHRFNVGVVGVFFDSEGKVLCFCHTYRELPWGVPTGWLNRAEQPAQGLRREIHEESGFDVEVIGVHRVDVDRSRVDVIMVGRFLGGQFVPSQEVDDWGLFSPQALPDGIHPPQIKLINEVYDAWQNRIQP